jgi:hypothetical protein
MVPAMTNSNSSSSPGNSPGDILNDLRQLVATVPPPPSPLLAIVHPSDLDQLLLDLEAAELVCKPIVGTGLWGIETQQGALTMKVATSPTTRRGEALIMSLPADFLTG